METCLDLEHLRTFAAVIEHGGFSRAAARLGIQKAAVSKIVQKLEVVLGVRLLERSSRVVRPTEAGRVLYTKGRALLTSAEEVSDEVRAWSDRVRGELVVGTSMELGAVLARHLVPKLQQRHPDLRIAFALSYDLANVHAEGIDAVLRIGAVSVEDLITVTVGELRRGLFAAPDYLAAHGTPKRPQDLHGHSLLGFQPRHSNLLQWKLERGTRSVVVPVEGVFCARSFSALLQAAAGGLGITALPVDLLAEAIRDAKLVPVLSDWTFPHAKIRALYPNRRFKPQKLVAFLDAVRELPILQGNVERAHHE